MLALTFVRWYWPLKLTMQLDTVPLDLYSCPYICLYGLKSGHTHRQMISKSLHHPLMWDVKINPEEAELNTHQLRMGAGHCPWGGFTDWNACRLGPSILYNTPLRYLKRLVLSLRLLEPLSNLKAVTSANFLRNIYGYGEHNMRKDHEAVINLKLNCIDVLAFISLPISDQSGKFLPNLIGSITCHSQCSQLVIPLCDMYNSLIKLVEYSSNFMTLQDFVHVVKESHSSLASWLKEYLSLLTAVRAGI